MFLPFMLLPPKIRSQSISMSLTRRAFLARTGVIAGMAAFQPIRLWGQSQPVNEEVENVLVIFKTHLDIGFTDTAAAVMKTYFEHFIPSALALTERIEQEQQPDRYIWTTGSWLIYRYLERASPENRRRMEKAIASGSFVWHGVPFSMECELMDRSLFRLGTAYSARLDQRFGRKTLAGKMTDVPGHTRGIVPVLAEAGIEMFHVGANEGSALPDTPPLFVWRSSDGAEVVVMCQHSYGGVAVLPGGKTAVSISFTHDNMGPHKPEEIAEVYADLRKQFPRARVYASNLNELAKELRPLRSRLPVVTQEIGNTWIHGPASDPLLVAQYREVSRLRREWIAAGKLAERGDVDVAFGERFLLIPEHTWGLSVKGALNDSQEFEMSAFRAARKRPEFRHLESSWEEKRANLTEAIKTLPPALEKEAKARVKALRPVRTNYHGMRKLESPSEMQETKHFRIGFDPQTGAIAALEHRETGRQWSGQGRPLGLLSYQTFSEADFNRFVNQYAPEPYRTKGWLIYSWKKPGSEKVGQPSALHLTALKQLWTRELKDGRLFVAELEAPEAARKLGCPHEITVETFLPHDEPTVNVTLKWFKKPACRLGEAIWFSFVPPFAADGRIEMDKMGQAVSPLDVVRNGSRNLHGLISGLTYQDSRGGFRLETLDAYLVSPGKRSLLNFDNELPDLAGGQHFCLTDNLTGTNYRMWCEDNMQFRFALKFGESKLG